MRNLKKLLALALALVMTAACATAFAEAPRTDISINVWEEPSALHGGFAAASAVNHVSRQIFDPLVFSDGNGQYSPALATAWEFQNDNKDMVFTLREGVKFHDGTTMTAEDVAFSYNTVINAGYADTTCGAMDSMEVVDDHTVVLHLDSEFGPIMDCVSQEALGIFPKAAYEADPEGFIRNPVGSGPYKFVEWRTGDRITLTAFEDYWQGEAAIKDLTIRIFTDNSVATLALQNGELDVHTQVPQTDVPNVEADPNLQYSEVVGNTTTWLIFNYEGIFADENLRLAVAHAIDKEGVMLGAIEGKGVVAQAIYAPFVPGYDAEYTGPAYDPEKAKEYLAAAGYPDGLDIVVKANSNSAYSRPLEMVQAYLADVGINISIEPMESNAWFDDVFQGADYDMNLVSFSMGMPDFDELYALYRGGQSQNFGHLDDPVVNEAYDINHSSVDPEARIEACHTIQHQMGDHALTVPIYTAMNGIAANAKLQGIEAKSMKDYRVYDWSWAE